MINEKRLKQEAKRVKKKLGILHHEALQLVANKYGFENWVTLRNELKAQTLNGIRNPTIQPNLRVAEISTPPEVYELFEEENAGILDSTNSNDLVRANMVELTKLGIEYSIFEPTLTGLKKSILDATQPVRKHFQIEKFHDYQVQEQGPTYKVSTDGYLVDSDLTIKTKVSLYRPKTKLGDPRMWFSKLSSFADAGDKIAIIIFENRPHLINLCRTDIKKELTDDASKVSLLLKSYIQKDEGIAAELLGKLRKLAEQPFKAQRKGDTAIGYTLETLLGIEANSSKLPDYKGIEIKSGRGKKTRTNLFAQVADWSLSPCGSTDVNFDKGSSAKILDNFGYIRDDDFKLYCTISSVKPNSQGLHFIYNRKNDQLEEWHDTKSLVAVWPGDLLRDRLLEKHGETFWVEAETFHCDGDEYFKLKSVTHTKDPIVSQLLPLIDDGVITMDHLIKRSGKTGKVSEKGPLFKINKRDLELLFPAPKHYVLDKKQI